MYNNIIFFGCILLQSTNNNLSYKVEITAENINEYCKIIHGKLIFTSGIISSFSDDALEDIKINGIGFYIYNGRNLRTLPENLFNRAKNMQTLVSIHMFKTKITYLPQNLFLGLPNLKDLFIVGSKLHTLPSKLLQANVNLVSIAFSSGLLTEIPIDLFAYNQKLRHIILSYNNLAYIDDKLFNKINVFNSTFNFANNNLVCLPNNLLKAKRVDDITENCLDKSSALCKKYECGNSLKLSSASCDEIKKSVNANKCFYTKESSGIGMIIFYVLLGCITFLLIFALLYCAYKQGWCRFMIKRRKYATDDDVNEKFDSEDSAWDDTNNNMY